MAAALVAVPKAAIDFHTCFTKRTTMRRNPGQGQSAPCETTRSLETRWRTRCASASFTASAV